MKKRFPFIILSAILVIAMLVGCRENILYKEIDGIQYYMSSREDTWVAGFCVSEMSEIRGEYKIPSEIDGIAVTQVGYAFSGTDVERVVFGDNIQMLHGLAFRDCAKLKEVVLNEGLKEIGIDAFDGTAITSITLPSSLETIYGRAFLNCPLKTVNLAVSIADLCKIDLPEGGVFPTGYDLFCGGKQVLVVNIPDSVKEVKQCTFWGSTVTSVDFGKVESIGQQAFLNCTSLEKVIIPATVTRIGLAAFANCHALAEIEYGGTKADWEKIKKSITWDHSTDEYEEFHWQRGYAVHCTDGDVIVEEGERIPV